MCAICCFVNTSCSEPGRLDSLRMFHAVSVARRSFSTEIYSFFSVSNNSWNGKSKSRQCFYRARVRTAVPESSDTPPPGSTVGAASTIGPSFSFLGLLSSPTTVGVHVQSVGKDICDDVDLIRQCMRHRSIDLCRWVEKEMKSSECGVTAILSLSAASRPSSTLLTGPPDSVETVKQGPSTETDEKPPTWTRNPDFVQRMVLMGSCCAEASSGRINSSA